MKQFHVSHNGEELGPFSAQSIADKVKTGEFSPMDFVYDTESEDWMAIMQCSEVSSLIQLEKPKPKARPKAESPSVNESHKSAVKNGEAKAAVNPKDVFPQQMLEVDWYVLKGENKFGPFSYPDVLKMLQQKIVFEFDFAWHPGLETWQRIAELSAFSSENISKIKETLMPEINEVFFRRKHRRVEFEGTVLVHNNSTVWKGQGVEISSGGVGVVIENSMLVPGDQVIVHFKPTSHVPAFNAACEVVSKKFVDGLKDKNAPVKYGLKFTGINKQMQEMLQNFSKHAATAA